MKIKIKTITIRAFAVTAALYGGTMGIAQAQKADTNLTTVAYWKFNQMSTTIPYGSGVTNGIPDLATNPGQGVLTGSATCPASEDDLYVVGGMATNFQIVGDAPPASMFNRGGGVSPWGYDGGGASWNAANNLNDSGYVLFDPSQFGNEFAGPSFTEEVFFKSAVQSSIKQTLIWNHQSSAYAHLQLNEDGNTGDLTFWGWDGANFQAVRLSNGTGRFDDGKWHYVACRFDATTKIMSIYAINQDGSSSSNSITLTQNLNPAGANDLYIGRSENQADRFNGEINQVRISSVALPNSALLAVPGGVQNPHIIAYWQMNNVTVGLAEVSGALYNATGEGILDLATNFGQGVLNGSASNYNVAASVDNLVTEGPLVGNMVFSNSVPPISMFNTNYPYNNGTASWDAGQVTAGDVVFPIDVYGDELKTPGSGFTEEVFFKADLGLQNTNKQTLIFNHHTSGYCILQINESANVNINDIGSLLFWSYNGTFPTVRITAAENGGQRFDDGNWHYAACRFDRGTTNMSLYIRNQDGTFVSKTLALNAPLLYGGSANTVIGNDESDTYPFAGLINQVRMSDAALPDQELLATPPPPCVSPVVFTSPASSTNYLNDVVDFSVVAGGTSPLYQWRLNGSILPGKTNSTLTVFPITTNSAGNYDVLVSTACSGLAVTSSVAVLTVIPTPRPVSNLALWSMEAQSTISNNVGNPAFNGVFDSDNPGQGLYPLITFNGLPGGPVSLTNDVPPASMFINSHNGGANSYDASAIASTSGALFYPQDQFGNVFAFRTSFSVELFFRSYGDQSGIGAMQLIKQAENNYRYALTLNQSALGGLRFKINGGAGFATPVQADLKNQNYADGQWHYVLGEYDAVANTLRIWAANTNGATFRASTSAPAGFSPLPGGNDGNLFVGRSTYPYSTNVGVNRTFIGAIDEVQVSQGSITTSNRLGFLQAQVPVITQIAANAGTVTVNFTGDVIDDASMFTLVSSPIVNGTYSNASATVTPLGGGKFQATVPVSGSAEFYRILHQ